MVKVNRIFSPLRGVIILISLTPLSFFSGNLPLEFSILASYFSDSSAAEFNSQQEFQI